jgi:hypothetical protein
LFAQASGEEEEGHDPDAVENAGDEVLLIHAIEILRFDDPDFYNTRLPNKFRNHYADYAVVPEYKNYNWFATTQHARALMYVWNSADIHCPPQYTRYLPDVLYNGAVEPNWPGCLLAALQGPNNRGMFTNWTLGVRVFVRDNYAVVLRRMSVLRDEDVAFAAQNGSIALVNGVPHVMLAIVSNYAMVAFLPRQATYGTAQ